jgi:hypothetical protein
MCACATLCECSAGGYVRLLGVTAAYRSGVARLLRSVRCIMPLQCSESVLLDARSWLALHSPCLLSLQLTPLVALTTREQTRAHCFMHTACCLVHASMHHQLRTCPAQQPLQPPLAVSSPFFCGPAQLHVNLAAASCNAELALSATSGAPCTPPSP